MLIVVEDGDAEIGEARLDLEAARRRDVLEVDATEDGRDRAHGRDDGIGVLRIEANREGVDARELAKEDRLSLHDGERGERPEVAEAEDRRAVGHDRDGVPLDGELTRARGRCGDRKADGGDAGRVGQAQVVPRRERHLARDGELSVHALVERERFGVVVGHRPPSLAHVR